MADHVFEQIMVALETKLADISTVNGYRTTVAEVNRGPIQPNTTPAINLSQEDWAPDDDNQAERNRRVSGVLTVSLEYWLADDESTPGAAANAALADMEEALFDDADDTLGGVADSMSMASTGILYRASGGELTGAIMDLNIRVSRLIGKPAVIL